MLLTTTFTVSGPTVSSQSDHSSNMGDFGLDRSHGENEKPAVILCSIRKEAGQRGGDDCKWIPEYVVLALMKSVIVLIMVSSKFFQIVLITFASVA